MGESVYVSNETWWIGKYDCKVTVESGDLEDNYKTEDVTVVRCHTDYKNHLLIETSNKYVIDVGHVKDTIDLSIDEYSDSNENKVII